MNERSGPPTVRVVRTGYVVRRGDVVERASSSVSLVESGRRRILVDTGVSHESQHLLEALSDFGVSPGSIDTVVNTHLHTDHIGGNDLFRKATLVAHVLEEPPLGTSKVHGELVLAPGVSLVPTPGHTRGSISVFVEGLRKYAIVGDALPTRGNYESRTPPFIHFDRDLAVRSLEAILAWAEVVIPGHDGPIEVERISTKT